MVFSWFRSQQQPKHRKAARTNRPRRPAFTPAVLQLEDRLVPSADPLANITHFVVVYQENWSFDGLYGSFPGANGIANASATSLSQLDRLTGQPYSTQTGQPFDLAYNGPALTTPPQPINNGAIDNRFPANLNTLQPYDINTFVGPLQTTGDIVHRYFQEQSQIDHGAQNQYVTWSDNPGLVMSHFDATNMPEGLLAQQYTMDDNFFHAAFGGSFLNHQFLVSAAAPVYQNAPASMVATLDANGQLQLNPMTGKIAHDGNITPIGGASFADPGQTFDKNYAINTIFSKNLAPDFVGNNTAASLLPSQNDSNPNGPNYIPTIGDRLDAANVGWKYYAGGWDNALLGSPSNPANNGAKPANDPADPLFQWHHQPLAYYDNFAPWLPNGQRNPLSAAHLQDENNFFEDLSAGHLPAVSFIKPLGPDNEHPGYASLLRGQQHVADIVHALQNSPDWAHTAVIVTYDENGGRWDHVSAPDANGIWGDGSRVPTIVISPYAKQGYVDHTQHDTLSILSTIEQRYHLQPLNSLDANASTLAADFQATPHISIGSAYVQPDANNVGKFTLIVQGTTGADNINVTLDGGNLHVTIKGPGVNYDHFFAQAISRIEVYGLGTGGGGVDQISVSNDVKVPAFLFGGAGFNLIQGGGGPTVEVGGSGTNFLIGGSGPSILIGGIGQSFIYGGSGGAILIGGTTNFDANAAGLRALLAEWSNSGETYAQRVAHLAGGASGGANGAYILDGTTVHDNQKRDQLRGGTGMDWFFARLSGPNSDAIFFEEAGEMVTAL